MIFSPGFTSVRLADYTGDGYASVTLYNKTTAVAYFGTGTGLGTFNFESLFWSPGYDWVEPEDVNGDGKVDVVLYDSTTGTEYNGLSNGDGTFAYTYQYWGIGRYLRGRTLLPTIPCLLRVMSDAGRTYGETAILVCRMAYRPDPSLFDRPLTAVQVKELHRKLAMLSPHYVTKAYKAHDQYRMEMDGERLPRAATIQELVKAWKVLRAWERRRSSRSDSRTI